MRFLHCWKTEQSLWTITSPSSNILTTETRLESPLKDWWGWGRDHKPDALGTVQWPLFCSALPASQCGWGLSQKQIAAPHRLTWQVYYWWKPGQSAEKLASKSTHFSRSHAFHCLQVLQVVKRAKTAFEIDLNNKGVASLIRKCNFHWSLECLWFIVFPGRSPSSLLHSTRLLSSEGAVSWSKGRSLS